MLHRNAGLNDCADFIVRVGKPGRCSGRMPTMWEDIEATIYSASGWATMDYRQAANDVMETEILTASPAKLRRMTLAFALQNINQAILQAEQAGKVRKSEATLNVREALDELLGGIRPSKETLSHQVADLYVFLLQCLTAAEADGDRDKLIDIRRVLEIELDTWTEVIRSTTPAPIHRYAPSNDARESICFDA